MSYLKGTRLSQLVLILMTLFFMVGLSQAGSDPDFDKGYRAYRAKNFTTAEKYFLLSAKRGYSEAQYRLGKIYEKGYLGKVDAVKMRMWYEKAAAQNHSRSLYKMGVGYARGFGGLEKNPTLAQEYMIKSANVGYKRAMKMLARVYTKGKFGIRKDKKKAKYWKKRYNAANQ